MTLAAGPKDVPIVLFEINGRAEEGEDYGDVPIRPIELTKETERYMKFRLK